MFASLLWPSQTLKMLGFFCFYWMFWNLVPLIETDGYYAVMDISGIPNLRKEAFSFLKSKVTRKSSKESAEVTQNKRVFLMGYALFSIAFVLFLAYNTYVILHYMAIDALSAVYRILQGTGGSLLAVDVASLAYFGLTVIGLITLPISLVRRRRTDAGE